MANQKFYYVYMLTNPSQRPFYTGVTGNLRKRIWQHQNEVEESYTAKYRLFRLVYVARFLDIRNAIHYEKKLKRFPRAQKIALVKSINPGFDDLSRQWSQNPDPSLREG